VLFRSESAKTNSAIIEASKNNKMRKKQRINIQQTQAACTVL